VTWLPTPWVSAIVGAGIKSEAGGVIIGASDVVGTRLLPNAAAIELPAFIVVEPEFGFYDKLVPHTC